MNDVATAAGVSRITVDRVLNGRGGVKPETEQLIIAKAKALGVDRALNVMPTKILRIGVVLQNNTNSFYVKLREGFLLIGQLYKRYNIRISFWYFEIMKPDAAVKALSRASAECDALIVILFDDPAVLLKVEEIATRLPIVTLASDLPNTHRIAYVGANAIQEGRTAAALMGKFLGGAGGDVIIIAGLLELLEHEQREVGFRNTMRRGYPACNVVETFESFENENIAKDVRKILKRHPNLRGIYNMSIGNETIAEELKLIGKEKEVFIITHTVTPERVALMNDGIIDAIIDRDPLLDARRAIEIHLHHAGRFAKEEISSAQRPQIFIRENVRLE